MASNLVNILVKADGSQATGTFDKVRKAVMGVSIATAGVALGLSKIGDEFKEASNNIRSATGATGKELENLTDSFKAVAGAVPQDMDTVSKALGKLSVETGLSGSALEQTSKMYLDLARVTGTEVVPMIDAVSDSMEMFGVSATDTEGVLNAFTLASQTTGVPLQQLQARVLEFGPVMKNLGMNMNDTIAFFGQLEGAGISASRVMPGINASMRRLAESGVVDLRQALIDGMNDIKNTEDEVEALNLATDLFGAEGAQRMKVAIQQGAVETDALATSLANAEGTVETLTEDTLTSGDQFDIWKGKVKLALEPLAAYATTIGPILIVLPTLMGILSFLAGLFKLQALRAAGATLALIAHKIAMIATATWSGIAAAAMWLFNAALTPIGLIILGIVAAVVLAIVVWKNWDKISAFLIKTWEKFDAFMTDKFGPTWEKLKEIVGGVIGFFKDIFKGFVALFTGDWDGAKEHFGNALTSMKNGFVAIFKGIWGWFKRGFSAVWNWLKRTVSSAVNGIKNIFIKVFTAIWDFFDNLMTNMFGGAWKLFKFTVKVVVEYIADLFRGLWTTLGGIWDLIVGIFTGDTDKIKEGFKGIVNGIITMWNALIKMVNKFTFTAPSWVPIIGGKGWSPSIPEIPMLAQGGIVTRPTLAMLGEGGAEAVIPLNRGGTGTGTVVNINILGPTYGFDDFEDRIAMSIRSGIRRGGFQGILNTG